MISDSTATVIGAMIIAPLAIPIQGVALAIAFGELRALMRSATLLLAACAASVALAAGLALLLPELHPLSDNTQVTGRVAPTLVDLVVAALTGLAGSLAVARRDISDILPGVAIAIAISLVPPLAVIGVTAAAGDWSGALGALLLFLTNVLAIIVAGVLLFSAIRVNRPDLPARRLRQAYSVVLIAGAVVVAALALLTFRTMELNDWQESATRIGSEWASGNGERLVLARFDGETLVLVVEGRSDGSRDRRLPALLAGEVPSGTPIIVDRIAGSRMEVGDVAE